MVKDRSKNQTWIVSLIGVVAIVGLMIPSLAMADAGYPSVGTPLNAERTGSSDVAIVVGVENYPWLPDVNGVLDTVRDWEIFFESGLGVPTIYTLVENQATREGMERFVDQAIEDIDPGATVWFVFVGHGAPDADEGDGLLVGVDAQADFDSLKSRSLRRSDLVARLERGRQEQTVMVLDACFTGESSGGEALVPGAQPVLPTTSAPRVGQKTVILSAAGAGEIAGPLPGMERPAFSYFLLGAMRGWAVDDGEEVSASQAISYTRSKIRMVRDRRQTPEAFGADDLVLVRGVSEPDPFPNWRGLSPAEQAATARLEAQRLERMEGVVVQEPQQAEQEPRTEEVSGEKLKEYEAQKIFESDQTFYQGSWTNSLSGAEFYRALGRDDLADKYRPYRPLGVIGTAVGLTGAGVGAGYLYGRQLASGSMTEDQSVWTYASTPMIYLGLLGASGGWYLGQAIFGERQPLNRRQKQGAVREFNNRLAQELGIPGHLTVAPTIGETVGLQMRVDY